MEFIAGFLLAGLWVGYLAHRNQVRWEQAYTRVCRERDVARGVRHPSERAR